MISRFPNVPITITIFSIKDGKMSYNSTLFTKREIVERYRELQKTYDVSEHIYECKLTYSRSKESWNAFVIKNEAQLLKSLALCLEDGLLVDLYKDNMINKSYMPERLLC